MVSVEKWRAFLRQDPMAGESQSPIDHRRRQVDWRNFHQSTSKNGQWEQHETEASEKRFWRSPSQGNLRIELVDLLLLLYFLVLEWVVDSWSGWRSE